MLMKGLRRQAPPGSRSGPAPPPNEAGAIPAAPAHLRYLIVEAGDHLGDRELSADFPRGLGADAQVLSHPIHRKAELELVVDHGLAAVLHLPGLRRAFGDHVEYELRVQAGLDGEVEALR